MLSIIEIITNQAQYVGNKTPKIGSHGRQTIAQSKIRTPNKLPGSPKEIRQRDLVTKKNIPPAKGLKPRYWGFKKMK